MCAELKIYRILSSERSRQDLQNTLRCTAFGIHNAQLSNLNFVCQEFTKKVEIPKFCHICRTWQLVLNFYDFFVELCQNAVWAVAVNGSLITAPILGHSGPLRMFTSFSDDLWSPVGLLFSYQVRAFQPAAALCDLLYRTAGPERKPQPRSEEQLRENDPHVPTLKSAESNPWAKIATFMRCDAFPCRYVDGFKTWLTSRHFFIQSASRRQMISLFDEACKLRGVQIQT